MAVDVSESERTNEELHSKSDTLIHWSKKNSESGNKNHDGTMMNTTTMAKVKEKIALNRDFAKQKKKKQYDVHNIFVILLMNDDTVYSVESLTFYVPIILNLPSYLIPRNYIQPPHFYLHSMQFVMLLCTHYDAHNLPWCRYSSSCSNYVNSILSIWLLNICMAATIGPKFSQFIDDDFNWNIVHVDLSSLQYVCVIWAEQKRWNLHCHLKSN